MKITIVAGARPNFVKIAPVIKAICKAEKRGGDLHYRLVHTGQHYDRNLSGLFFEDLQIPEPDVNLGAGGGSQAEQTAAIMVAFERELIEHPADLVMVFGDVTSTLACSVVAKKLCVKVAHVEAGIRSWDLSMPEEINRMVTDSITDIFFTTSEVANANLKRFGVSPERIHFVGNVMIDTLMSNRLRFRKPDCFDEFALEEKKYFVLTLHRPGNVDEESRLKEFLEAIVLSARGLPIVFPVHPRTRKHLEGLRIAAPNLKYIDPLGYLEFNFLVEHSMAVVTDSGGITEETTIMGVPCMTLRDNTERPETVSEGTNELIGTNPSAIPPAFAKVFDKLWKKGMAPELWDGHAAERIVSILLS